LGYPVFYPNRHFCIVAKELGKNTTWSRQRMMPQSHVIPGANPSESESQIQRTFAGDYTYTKKKEKMVSAYVLRPKSGLLSFDVL